MRRVWYVATAFLLFACASPPGDESAAAGAALETSARICSWNIRRLGHEFDGHEKDIAATASIITENCDVIAVQEVMQRSGGVTPGYTALLTALGSDWDGVITKRPRPDTTSANSEHYAFYFRKSAAALCTGWTDGVKQLPDAEDAFLREPGWTCLKVNASARDLLLVSYHAIYGAPIDRKREVGLLDDDLDEDGRRDDVTRTVHASRRDADVVLVGDFNLKPNELADVLPTYKDLVTGTGSTINQADEITDNLYNHVIVAPDEPLATVLQPAEVLDVRKTVAAGMYFSTVSDHLPIRFVLGHHPTPTP